MLQALHFVTISFFSHPEGGYFHVNINENNRPQEVRVCCSYRQKASRFLAVTLKIRLKQT
jgi:hypothetical protein